MGLGIQPTFITEEEAEKRKRIVDCRGRQIHQRDTVVVHAGHGRLKEASVIVVNPDDPQRIELGGIGRVSPSCVAVVY